MNLRVCTHDGGPGRSGRSKIGRPTPPVAVILVNVADVHVDVDTLLLDVVKETVVLKVAEVIEVVVGEVEVTVVRVTELWVAVVVAVLEVANCKSHPSNCANEKKNVRATSAGASDPNASSISSACPVRSVQSKHDGLWGRAVAAVSLDSC